MEYTGREIVAQTNGERRNKGFFEFIARQVIGLHQAGFLSLFFHVSWNLILEISSRPALNENSSMTLRRVLPGLLRLHAPVSCKSTEQWTRCSKRPPRYNLFPYESDN